ncbi:hypothetical protein EO98_11700 [Methanosarcina sp. 2.H.T.1A.6]|uniref:glycosyltransferase n=1 Tax=Methanosarcina sp. 2.H.T.1A.3 TaxID=1483597 RepID=UPI0006218367|nr:glycosyltransferase [Methanosarcina sp. 2.H.T.1A.3]KKG17794.1 hypothetical protein EO94_13775 [Methanosarcina sp. 2.H.T.1A.3]KKG19289.1 hypothetical protein EO98_11700 [Methanosarcina sp. 2.H.T.1A.6]KKG20822.1 hypothetical protein EO97_19775 [Methanosarcina sp. 2.H.T.1A.15]KKG25303.1 hypothetical protein EO96_13940 [Methanosarcina sp. 2.H.T.1A.8]
MKILQVIASFPPAFAYGGPAGVVYEISKELVKRGHEVTVYTTDVLDQNSRYKFENNPMWLDGIEVYHFKNISYSLVANFHMTCAFGIALELRNNIKKFDVIHCHEYRAIEAIFTNYYAKKYNIPFILQPRGTMPTLKKSRQKKIFDTFFGHNIIKNSNKIIASSKTESDQYSSVCPEINEGKIIHIPNGINLDIYQNLPKKGSFRNKYSISENDKVILFLSRLHERKGADILIESFSDLQKEIENVKLVIAGPDDGFLNELKSIVRTLEIEKDVIFTGPLYETNKLEAYVDADVFVLPSKDRYESFGNVVLEAFACRTPVIVTSVCGVTEWIENVGYTVDCDISQIKDAMFQILTDEMLNKKLRTNGNSLVTNKFSWDSITTKIEETYFLSKDNL